MNGDTRTPSELAAHNMFWYIHHQNIQTLSNPPAPAPIVAGVAGTAMGALTMLNAGIQPPLLAIRIL